MPRALSVSVDGTPMPDDEAVAFWKRFSEHMEANQGDLAGFAKSEGFMSVTPEVGVNGPVLRVSKTVAQGAYKSAKKV